MSPTRTRDLLQALDFTTLFIEELGWSPPATGQRAFTLKLPQPIGTEVTAAPIAQLGGLTVFRLDWPYDRTPGVTARRAVQRALAPTHAEHLVIYVAADGRQLAFTWARRRGEGRIELRTLPYEAGSPARTTLERLALLQFTLDELDQYPNASPPITAVTAKLDAAFDVEAVTKQFYQEIANWYFWARQHVEFPMPKGTPNADAYQAQSLIRLITRLIFCWFVKQKGLIPGALFDSRALAGILKNGANLPASEETTYYKAILQNLFFATLNQEMNQREFRKRNKHPGGRDPHHGITNLYRYEDYFTDPQEFLRLMQDIPFLNGGLFECLDKVYRAEENLPDVRMDGFSDHPKNPLRVPDFLFFGEERTVDLSAAYGEKRYRQAKVRGLIHTFARYNFTITEATPLDQEVALDPELSGKVFENLLAAYNPETATTARKQTGSFYTPREIVDYMVDEALLAYLETKLITDCTDTAEQGQVRNPKSSVTSVTSVVEQKLRHLLAYNDEPHQFSPAEVKVLIAAIDNLKALDPACGSGAFPMGLLHKLVLILGKLDPHNEQWKQQQIAKASEIPDATVREKTLADIEQAFAANELDYGRKLYLIENCIYGVDLQPIAVQIAKMRFFISLIVDQRVDDTKPNRGILSLPNLETKFVAANTLIGIEKPPQQMLRNPQIDAKEAELRRVRERHFTARTPATKAKCREQDAKLRAEISELLHADGFPHETTEKLAKWNPYDQNASADFFDPEWMFGIKDGFDIVIGNPPYVRIQQIDAQEAVMLKERFTSATGKFDAYVCFIEKGFQLLSPSGCLVFINPNKFLTASYGHGLRTFIIRAKALRLLVDFGESQNFESATTYTCILLLQRSIGDTFRFLKVTSVSEFAQVATDASQWQQISHPRTDDPWVFGDAAESRLTAKLSVFPSLITACDEIFQGLISGGDKLFYLELIAAGRECYKGRSLFDGNVYEIESPVCFKLLKGAEIKRYEPLRARFMAIFPYHIDSQGRTRLIDERTLSRDYPKCYKYFSTFRQELTERGSDRMVYEHWYAYWCPRSLEKFRTPKIVTQVLASKASFTLDDTGRFLFVGGGNAGGYGIIPKAGVSLFFMLGLLNSRLLDAILKRISSVFRGGFYSYARRFLEHLPFAQDSVAAQLEIEKLVERILAAKRADPAADTTIWEREIDERVYRLYGLTREEIRMVEETSQ